MNGTGSSVRANLPDISRPGNGQLRESEETGDKEKRPADKKRNRDTARERPPVNRKGHGASGPTLGRVAMMPVINRSLFAISHPSKINKPKSASLF